MEKIFILIKINNKKSYKPFCEFVYAIYDLDFQILLNYKFQYFCKIDFNEGMLVYIDEVNKNTFINALLLKNIPFEIKDLSNEYIIWMEKKDNIYEKLDDSFLKLDLQETIVSIEIPQIIENPDGSQYLIEEEIIRKDKIKIYTHSNEQCGHHIPHVHIEYNNIRNFCVISLKDFCVLQPKNCLKSAKIKKCIALLMNYIDDARLSWNKSSGRVKFKIVDGRPTSEFI